MASESVPTSPSASILCIDDDPDILLYLQTVLEAEGFRFVGADSAEEGLRVYDRERPDLIMAEGSEVAGWLFDQPMKRTGSDG